MEDNIKSGDAEIKKYKFCQYKKTILIKNIDDNKIVVSNKISFDKKSFKYFIGFRDSKKLDLYPYFSRYEFMTLMKLNMFFFYKRQYIIRKI